MKVISHNQRIGRPLLEYLLIGVALGLFVFGFWAYKQIDEAGKSADGSVSTIQPPPPGTTEEVDWVTEGDIAAERALDETYDDDEAEAASTVESAADEVGGVYDESNF